MKKNYKFLMSLGLGLFFSGNMFSQAINENFQDVPALFTSGWAQQNLSTPIGTLPNWVQGNTAVFPANSLPDTSYIAANYNSVTGANTISNWLFAPNRTFNNGDIITFYTRTVASPTYADNLQVRLSTNGSSVNAGTTNTSVGDFTNLLLEINPTLVASSYPNVWTQYTITLSGLAGPTSGRIAFRYFVTNGGPSGANSDYIGIDNFVYTPAGSSAPDLTAGVASDEYTLVPLTQVKPITLVNQVTNIGTAPATNAVLTANVYAAPNFTTPIQTSSSTATTIANGTNSIVNTGATFTPSAVGTYVIEYITSCTGNTVTSADSSYYTFSVTDSTYARDNGTVVGGLGIGAGDGGNLGNTFEVVAADQISSVTGYFTRGYTGRPYSFSVWSTTVTGVPSAIVANTDTLLYPNDSARLVTVGISGGPFTLAPGNYVVTVNEFVGDSTVQIGTTNDIFTYGKSWVYWPSIPGGNWANVETFGASFAKTFVIRANFAPVATGITETSSSSLSIYPNPSNGFFTVKMNATAKTVVEVYNMIGKLVYSTQLNNNMATVDLSNHSAGVYSMKVISGNTTTVKQIVLTK